MKGKGEEDNVQENKEGLYFMAGEEETQTGPVRETLGD